VFALHAFSARRVVDWHDLDALFQQIRQFGVAELLDLAVVSVAMLNRLHRRSAPMLNAQPSPSSAHFTSRSASL
jgi:hypothetical protein